MSRLDSNDFDIEALLRRQELNGDNLGASPMTNTTEVRAAGQLDDDEPLIHRVEVTDLGEGGMSEGMLLHLRYGICGHLTRTAEQVGGRCAGCAQWLCTECASDPANKCEMCKTITCGACQRHLFLVPEISMVCRSCYRKWWIREIAIMAALGGLIVFLYHVFF